MALLLVKSIQVEYQRNMTFDVALKNEFLGVFTEAAVICFNKETKGLVLLLVHIVLTGFDYNITAFDGFLRSNWNQFKHRGRP